MKKYLYAIPFIIAAAAIRPVLQRELWFDEALTLLNFVLPLDLGKIYFSYIIPNNQIVYSITLKLWDMFYIGYTSITVYWRLLSTLFAFGTFGVLLYLNKNIDKKRAFSAITVLSAVSLSAVFLNYATALRGYAASCFFTALALLGLYNIFHKKARSGWLIYIISSILAVGTVPTNLLALAAAWLYAVPWMQKEFWQDKKAYISALIIPLALIIFYAPIAGSFLATFKLGEGFSGSSQAAFITLGMYASLFGLLLFFGLCSLKKPTLPLVMRYLVWFLPLAPIYILHQVPFPRVFVTLLPVLIMLVTDGIFALTASDKWRNFHRAIFFLVILASQSVMVIAGAVAAEKCKLSRYEDDFFHPWYMFPGYKITDTIGHLKEIPPYKAVFLSFSADPAPILFYALNNALEHKFSSDIPFGSVKTLPQGSIAVLRHDEDPAIYEKRFGKKFNLLYSTRLHNIFELAL